MTWVPDDVLEHVGEVATEPDLSGTRYRLQGLLGRGGMGVVYAAFDVELEREVAIKVSLDPRATANEGDRVRREARVLARLEHPGIVPVHDVGELPDGRVFYVMKRVRGVRLDVWAASEPDGRARLRLFQRLCEAVARAHAEGVIHRDLKPENVMIGAFGEAWIMDWGIAHVLSDGAETQARGASGTAAYMAPEQVRGELAAIDARTDVYALGGMLLFLLEGAAPEDRRRRDADPPTSRALVAICAKARADQKADRYEGALALAAEVGLFLDGEPVRAYDEGLLDRAGRFASRNAVMLSLVVAYVVLRLLLAAASR